MKRVVLILATSLVVFYSCRKEKLEGETAFLIGKWRYYYYQSTNGVIGGNSVSGTNQDIIEFCKNGDINLYESSGKLIEECRLKSIELIKGPYSSSLQFSQIKAYEYEIEIKKRCLEGRNNELNNAYFLVYYTGRDVNNTYVDQFRIDLKFSHETADDYYKSFEKLE